MRKTSLLLAKLAISATVALTVVSCTDDGYYSMGGSYNSGYNSSYGGYTGYGAGYGYGNSNFSTSLFVSTGNPQWGYDPYCYSYYDYNRRCYYDPYLYGYYPRGYRPPVIVGAPHPYGYRHTYCPPPNRVTSVTLVNYNRREQAYRNSSYSWARQVRQQPMPEPRSNSGGRTQYQQHQQQNPAQRPPSSGFWGNREQAPSYTPSRGGSSQVQPTPQRYPDRQTRPSPNYNVPIQTRPAPSEIQSRPDRSRPTPSIQPPQIERNRPQREVSPMGMDRPGPQPVQRSVPERISKTRPVPSAPTPAPSPEVRGLGEVSDGPPNRGRGR